MVRKTQKTVFPAFLHFPQPFIESSRYSQVHIKIHWLEVYCWDYNQISFEFPDSLQPVFQISMKLRLTSVHHGAHVSRNHWQTWLGLVIPLIMQYNLIFCLLTFIFTILRMENVFMFFHHSVQNVFSLKICCCPIKSNSQPQFYSHSSFFIQIEHRIQKCQTRNLQSWSNKRKYFML